MSKRRLRKPHWYRARAAKQSSEKILLHFRTEAVSTGALLSSPDIRSETKKNIRSIEEVKIGSELETRLGDGIVISKVSRTEEISHQEIEQT